MITFLPLLLLIGAGMVLYFKGTAAMRKRGVVMSASDESPPRPPKRSFSQYDRLCLQCGSIGTTRRYMKGSLLTEFVLWLCFLIPGLIYSIWRHSSVYYGCRQCEGANVIPLNTPIAQKFLSGKSA